METEDNIYPKLPRVQNAIIKFLQYYLSYIDSYGIGYITHLLYPIFGNLGMRRLSYLNRFDFIGDFNSEIGFLTACGVIHYSMGNLLGNLLPQLVKKRNNDLNFIDIGANIGFVSLLGCSSISQRVMLHCFEPNPDIFKVLSANISMNGFPSHLNQVAVGDIHKTGNLILGIQSGNSTLIHSDLNLELGYGEIKVEIITLDEYFSAFDYGPDIIKIDVEGYEPAVILGANRVFELYKPYVIIEINPKTLLAAGSSDRVLLNQIKEKGYDTYYIDNRQICISRKEKIGRKNWNGYIEILEHDLQGLNLYDVIAVPTIDAEKM